MSQRILKRQRTDESFDSDEQPQVWFRKLVKGAPTPRRQNPGDPGFELSTSEEFELYPGETKTILTGIVVKIPSGYYGQIESRSFLYLEYGVIALGGIIRSDYDGEVKVALMNVSEHEYLFEKWDKIAQILFLPLSIPRLVEVVSSEDDEGDGSEENDEDEEDEEGSFSLF